MNELIPLLIKIAGLPVLIWVTIASVRNYRYIKRARDRGEI